MMKMLYGMGFESKEEVEGVFKRVDDNGKVGRCLLLSVFVGRFAALF